jgi:hypothetical protein
MPVIGVKMRPMLQRVVLQPLFPLMQPEQNLRNFPLGCRPWPPQFAADKNGTVILSQLDERARW